MEKPSQENRITIHTYIIYCMGNGGAIYSKLNKTNIFFLFRQGKVFIIKINIKCTFYIYIDSAENVRFSFP